MDNGVFMLIAAADAIEGKSSRKTEDEINETVDLAGELSFKNVYTSTPRKCWTNPNISTPLDLSMTMSIFEDEPLNLSLKENVSAGTPLDLAMIKSMPKTDNISQKILCPLNLKVNNDCNVDELNGSSSVFSKRTDTAQLLDNKPPESTNTSYDHDNRINYALLSPTNLLEQEPAPSAFDRPTGLYHDLENHNNVEEGSDDSNNDACSVVSDSNEEKDDQPIGDATLLNMFSIEEYFLPYHNDTVVGLNDDVDLNSTDDDDGQEIEQCRQTRRTTTANNMHLPKCNAINDIGLQDISCEIKEKQRNKRTYCKEMNILRKQRGLSYTRSNGSTVPARSLKPVCQCKHLQCHSKYSQDVRKSLLENFLKLSQSAQNQFIANHITVSLPASSKVINSRRSYSRKYFLPGVGGMVRVCQRMFLATLDIGTKKARYIGEKKVANGGVAQDDKRCKNSSNISIPPEHVDYIKKHIQSFPAYSSHYGREKSTKKYLSSDLNVAKMYEMYVQKCATDNLACTAVHYNSYRIIFRKFNLGFRKPKIDTCDTCDKFKTQILATTDEFTKTQLETLRNEHHDRAKFVYDQKRRDIDDAKNDGVCTVSFDLQKCLPTPHLTTSRAYYSRQLYTYNLTVFATYNGNNSAHCFLWDETKARRGSQEIGSCVYHFIQSFLEKVGPVSKLNLFSDKCSGQNHNFVFCMLMTYITEKLSNQGQHLIITHNFMVSGHSHMEVDSIHAAIEKAKKANSIDIEIPKDWAILVSQIKRKVPINVVELESKDFYALKRLEERYKKPRSNTVGESLSFQKIMVFQYNTHSLGKIYYKLDPKDELFACFEICDGNILQDTTLPELKPITLEPLELPTAKLEDLKNLLPYIKNKQYYQAFLKNLSAPKRGRKKQKIDNDSFDNDLSLEEFYE